ncbi:MAG: SAM-dependent methyltransferase, partial [Desulfobulbus sp.]|nr:SAM-dependent methyltransferase [Desulfobulbus sp.]
MKQPAGKAILAVALISGAALGYELVLLRFFSLMYWDHFAHLIISMALLGFGLAGSVLSQLQHRLVPAFPRSFAVCSLLFAISLMIASSLAGRLGFNPPEVIWQGRQMLRLAAVFTVTTVPFFFAGLSISLTLRSLRTEVTKIYRADLCGAAAGSLFVFSMLFLWPPEHCLKILALAGLSAAMVVVGLKHGGRWQLITVFCALVCMFWPNPMLVPVMSEYKGLAQALLVPGVRVAADNRTPAGEYTALASDNIPFRYAPGLSLLAPVLPPEQIALFQDGHAAGVIERGADGLQGMEFLRWTPQALAYVLAQKNPRVLVIGAGGGTDVWHARMEGAARIDAVEQNRGLIDLVTTGFALFSGDIYRQEQVHLHRGDIRGFLAAGRQQYDLIKLSSFGTAVPAAAGSGHALQPLPFFTVEGMQLALSRLTPNGLLSLTLPLELPPRSALKACATMVTALQQLDSKRDPFAHLIVTRTWNTVTLVMSRAPLTVHQLEKTRIFCRERAFDLDWLPGLGIGEVNQVSVLDQPYLHEAVLAMQQGRSQPLAATFYLDPAVDDRPWFSHFFRWSSLPSLWVLRTGGTAGLLEWEYLLLWMSLAVALVISLPAIILPLYPIAGTSEQDAPGRKERAAWIVYFASLGLAFFFVEIAFMQQWIMFLRDPVLAMAVIVPSFLFFAGLGSGAVGRLQQAARLCNWSWGSRRPVTLACTVLVLVACAYLWLLSAIFEMGAGWPLVVRVLVSIGLIGALAFWMGMPFPLGLQRL